MFLPDNIDLAHSERYNLSIRLAPNGFSFLIFNPADPSQLHFQETGLSSSLLYIDNIKKLIFDLGFFSQPFNKTSVTVVSAGYTLLPTEFFDSKQIKEIFNFNFHNPKGVVLSDSSSNGEYHTIFNLDEELYSFLTRHLYGPLFHHHTSLLLELFEGLQSKSPKGHCFIDFHDNLITLISFSRNQLKSANSFEATNHHDTSYYIMSLWEKLEFDQNLDLLHLSGDWESQKESIQDLKQLIRNVRKVELQPKAALSSELKKEMPTDMIAALCV